MKIVKTAIWLWIVPVALMAAVIALPAWSYLTEFDNSSFVPGNPDHWSISVVHYRLNPTSAGANIHDQGTTSVATVIQNSFATWTSVANVGISVSRDADDTLTSPTTSENLIAFACNGSNCDFNTDGTLAITITNTNNADVITNANIFFNQTQSFTTVHGNANTFQDLQTVATHEIGHFFGMDHTGVVAGMMFPIAPTLQTQISDDDVAGITSIYPTTSDGGTPHCPPGTARISGHVTLNSAAVFGAHIFAEPVSAPGFGGPIRKSPIGTLSLPDGTYQIACMPPGSYVVVAEPLDGPVSDSDVSWAGSGGVFTSKSAVQTNFTTRWH